MGWGWAGLRHWACNKYGLKMTYDSECLFYLKVGGEKGWALTACANPEVI